MLTKKINFYDTAPSYGFGKVETILSKLLKNNRSKIFLSTKAGLYKKKTLLLNKLICLILVLNLLKNN